jgi:hypothetical protein
MTRIPLAVALAVAVGVPVRLPAADESGTAAPRLAGRWQLDKEKSEDARAKMREARGGERPRGWGGGPGGGGMGGGMGGGGRMGGGRWGGRGGGDRPEGGEGGSDRPARSGFREFFEPAATLEITQDEHEVAIDAGEGRVLRVHPDGHKTKSEGGESEVKARWNGSELVVENKLQRGGKLTNVYVLAAEGRELHVTSRLDGRVGDPVTVRRVYTTAPEAANP